MKKLVAAMVVAGLALTACSSSSGGSSDQSGGAPAAKALDDAKGVTTVTFWHSMTGQNATVLTSLVDAFNQAHQGRIEVKAVFQGTYDDAVTKYKASVQQ